MGVGTKKCRGPCGLEKPVVDFYVHTQMADGRLNVCKVCVRARTAARYWSNGRKPCVGWYKPESRNPNTGHKRALKIVGERSRCELERIGGCRGTIEVHHKDKDPGNNERTNLMVVCRAHHKMLDNGRLDPDRPVMPKFYVGSDGKRRYEKRTMNAEPI